MQKLLKILLLVIAFTSCNVNKKNENSTLFYKNGDIFFQSYQYYKAIDCYKKYIHSSEPKNDSLLFQSYIQLYRCYCAINNKKLTTKVSNIIDSLKKISMLNKYKFDYNKYLVFKNIQVKEPRKIIQSIQNILPYFQQNDTLLAPYYFQLGESYYYLNIFDSSGYFYKKAIEIAHIKKNKLSFELVTYYSSYAYFLSISKNAFDKVKIYIDSAIFIASKTQNIDSINYAGDLLYIGYIYHFNGKYKIADHFYNKAYQIYDQLNNYQNEKIKVLLVESSMETYLNKFDAAISKTDQAIAYFKKNNSTEQLINALRIKTSIYYFEHMYEKSLISSYETIYTCHKANLEPTTIDYYNLANCYERLMNKDSAIYYFEKSMVANQKKEIIRTYFLTTIVGQYSRFLNSIHLYKASQNVIEKYESEIRLKCNPKDINFAFFIYWKALTLQNLKKYDESLKVYQEVTCNSIEPDFYGSNYDVPIFDVSQIISYDNLIDALIGKGDVLSLMAKKCENNERRLYLYEKSYEHYIKAKEVVENHNRQMDTEDDQLKFAGIKSPINIKIFTTVLQIYYLTHSADWLEKLFIAEDNCKANVISMNVLDNVYKKLGGIPDSLIQRDKKMNEQIAQLQNLLYDEKKSKSFGQAEISNNQNKLVSLLKESEKLGIQLEDNYLLYHQLKYQSHNVNIEQLSRFMGNQKSIVEYEFAGDSLYTFLLSNNSIKLFSQSSAGIDDSITKLRKLITNVNDKSFTEKGIKEYISSASWLYKKLFQPIIYSLNNNDIIIIPDGTINLLPFEALVTNTVIPNHADYGSLNYLVNKYTFSYSFSSELYTMQQQLNSPSVDGVLAFAPNYESYTNPKHRSSIMLSPLTGNTSEAKKVVKIMDGESIIGKQATKETFLETMHENKILHLAMHAIVDNDNSNSSALAFTQTNDTDANNLLYSYEISNLNLNTPLAVLSACNTGNGQLMKGEGLVSLARSFVYAGCPSMVYALWSISDNSTSEFMQEFYENLKQYMTIDKALQTAKNKYISMSDPRYAHPHYWAAFVQSGKTQAIQIKMPHSFNKYRKMVLIIFISLIVISFIIFGSVRFYRK